MGVVRWLVGIIAVVSGINVYLLLWRDVSGIAVSTDRWVEKPGRDLGRMAFCAERCKEVYVPTWCDDEAHQRSRAPAPYCESWSTTLEDDIYFSKVAGVDPEERSKADNKKTMTLLEAGMAEAVHKSCQHIHKHAQNTRTHTTGQLPVPGRRCHPSHDAPGLVHCCCTIATPL